MARIDYIANIRNVVLVSDQSNLFVDDNNTQLINACIEYLKVSGYKIIELPKYIYTVKSLDELISFFYSMLELKHPGYISGYRNMSGDRAIAKRFVEARIKASGFNKKEALNECTEIIRTVFDHESEFNFKYKITFKIFGQDKLGWVTDKAIQIINNTLEIENEELAEKRREEMIDAQDTKNLGFDNLQGILDQLEKKNNKERRNSDAG